VSEEKITYLGASLFPLYHGDKIKGNSMGGTRSNLCECDKNLKGQIHSKNAVVGMIILKPIFRKYDLMVSRYIWFVLQMGNCERS
jgi:hypothetical protein